MLPSSTKYMYCMECGRRQGDAFSRCRPLSYRHRNGTTRAAREMTSTAAFVWSRLDPINLHTTTRRVRASFAPYASICANTWCYYEYWYYHFVLWPAQGANEFRNTVGACRLAQTSRRPTRTLPETQMLARTRTSALRRVNSSTWCNYKPLRSVAFILIHGFAAKGPSILRE
ncbi:hypothetical protein M431DRAFT_375216 [Trichoderma harzianum CBS 226.95]|uniref:Uncharacterized protein n=1 Tax=Trichoderma harzianum CBS 226.95 TaxID=983964 RepID=A0A2T4AH84_TRIHA|nr:hypothetical protein M431DRAFT_375216 [Trichoderma harzianum CBS 226.95]PTB56417.1 hypothetical protein M431DRAFT_375216 [Trichoderma harzianum CBS 226.95]